MTGLFIIGIAMLAGLLGGKIFNKFGVPAVGGYVVIGIILGSSVLGVFSNEVLNNVGVMSDLALGLIAFGIGGALKFDVLKKLGKSIFAITTFEALFSFILVTLSIYIISRDVGVSLILGAVASATAPAATVMVINEYKAAGTLTTTLLAVVGLDDAFALIVYGFASAIAKVFLQKEAVMSFNNVLLKPVLEVFGAVLLGVICGFILVYFMRFMRTRSESFTLAIGGILAVTGLSQMLNISGLLANMALGMIAVNYMLHNRREIFNIIDTITPPIYAAFFVLAGAWLQIGLIPQLGVLGILYFISRIIGKVSGASIGGYLSKAPEVVRKYIGYGLLSQVGVAVGLAIMVNREFGGGIYGEAGKHLGVIVINVLLATTILTEIIGPIMTKFAISKAGEVGKRQY